MDESAYLSQAFYADLLLRGDGDNPLWLNYAGYDLPPLPKYLIGWSLRVGGFRRPPPSAAWAWYENPGRRIGAPEALIVARIPSVILGAIGCLAIYALGALAFDRRAGWLAALLLMANPLYRMHARRAMSDVPAEAFLLASLAFALWAWKRWVEVEVGVGKSVGKLLVMLGLSGLCCGLATLSKLNGALAGFVLIGWMVLGGLLRPGWKVGLGLVSGALLVGGIGLTTFILLNPFVTARPSVPLPPQLAPVAKLDLVGRLGMVADHRVSVSINATRQFPHDALTRPVEKIEAVAIQGFGRFSPLGPRGRTDSTRRFEFKQDWGAIFWLPLVLIGFMVSIRKGLLQRRSQVAPTAWAIAIYWLIALAVVTAFIPLAWDRYYLSIQPGSTLMVALFLVAILDRFRQQFPEGVPS